MSTQMIIRLDDDTKNKMVQFAKAEGKNTSQVVRELIAQYIQERDIGAYVDDLWQRTGNKLKDQGVNPQSIQTAIKQVRKNENESRD